MADPEKPGDTPSKPAAAGTPAPASEAEGAAKPARKKRASRAAATGGVTTSRPVTAKTATKKKTATRKKVAGKKTAGKKTAAKKTATRKTAARKSPAASAAAAASQPARAVSGASSTISTAARASTPVTLKGADDVGSAMALWAPLVLIGLLILVFAGDDPPPPASGNTAPASPEVQSSIELPSSLLTPEPPAVVTQPAMDAAPLAPAEALRRAFEEATVISPAPGAAPPAPVTAASNSAAGEGAEMNAYPTAAIPPPQPMAGGAPPPALPGTLPANPWAPRAGDYSAAPGGGSLWPVQPQAPSPGWNAPAGQTQ